MKTRPEFKRFIQQTLGCRCPDGVFDKIHYAADQSTLWKRKVTVGDRLLIYIVNADMDRDLREQLDKLLQAGITERDTRGFNRFRLVLSSARPASVRTEAVALFDASTFRDDKTHLHIVRDDQLAWLE